MDDSKSLGITFYLETSEVSKPVGGKCHGTVSLTADVYDIDTWDQVLKSLDELCLYKGSDIKTELIEMLQEKNTELEESREKTTLDLQGQIQQLTQRKGIVEQELLKAQQRIRILEASLETQTKKVEEWDKVLSGGMTLLSDLDKEDDSGE